jgi:N utilization substance protein B
MSAGKRLAPETIAARRAARLATVQALYQMETAGATLAMTLADVRDGRLPAGEDGALDGEVDVELFRQLVEAAVEHQARLDTILAKNLAQGWRLERLDAVARAILRAGLMELWRRQDVPTAAVIDEYVEIAKAFFWEKEPGFINATLDAAAATVREAP